MVGHALLTDLCSGVITLNQLAGQLHDLQLSGLTESQAAAVERFKYIFISRQLRVEESIDSGLQSLRHCLERNDTWQGGEVPPVVAIALTGALSCLGLIDFDPADEDEGVEFPPLFGELDAVISDSAARDTWQAGLVCSILQARYAERIRECIYKDMAAFDACCLSFKQAVNKLGAEFEKPEPLQADNSRTAMVICNSAFAKAFLQVVSHDADGMLMVAREPRSPFEESAMRVLRDELGGSETVLAASPVVRTLRLHLLKELRRFVRVHSL